jgi:isopentenyldiphosphate isomerase
LIAEEDEELTVKPDENSDVAWIAVEEMNKMSNEPEMIPVYQKLYERALEIKNKQKSH